MSHKQTNSLTIPFSWEKVPGVPKFTASQNVGSVGGLEKEASHKVASLPPPPPPGCLREPMMKKSTSSRFWREEDPFLVALKECSKDDYKVKGDKKRFGIWGNKSFLRCRCSFDVEEGNLRKRPLHSRAGPVISQERVHGLIRMHKGLTKCNT